MNSGEVLCIIQTRMKEVSRRQEEVRFCFVCREHRQHWKVVMVDEDPESYYGAHVELQCDRCGRDHTRMDGERRRFGEGG